MYKILKKLKLIFKKKIFPASGFVQASTQLFSQLIQLFLTGQRGRRDPSSELGQLSVPLRWVEFVRFAFPSCHCLFPSFFGLPSRLFAGALDPRTFSAHYFSSGGFALLLPRPLLPVVAPSNLPPSLVAWRARRELSKHEARLAGDGHGFPDSG